jgi:hypothetical protein
MFLLLNSFHAARASRYKRLFNSMREMYQSVHTQSLQGWFDGAVGLGAWTPQPAQMHS